MKVGRPTLYTPKLLDKARKYLHKKRPTDDEFIPTIEGLCLAIKITRETAYAWQKEDDKKEFSDILAKIMMKQSLSLIQGGISGKFNSTITKLMLTKHGYSEKSELDLTTGGKPLNSIKELTDAELINLANRSTSGTS